MAKKIIEKIWDHSKYEEHLYRQWEEAGYFKPEKAASKHFSRKARQQESKTFSFNREIEGKPFVISMPPPNVTGKLHMGHALVVTLEDIMTRYHRLLQEPTLWLPGTDHGGIATQTVVEKDLKKRGIEKKDLGREKFIEKVWEWKEKYGGIISDQIRRLGASCDWSRERFTLDEDLSLAVRQAFVDLYKEGLIYRDYYIVNWCPRCRTAIADDEVEYRAQRSKLYYFKYDKNFPIIIASTRPETKLGDTAVAVHPEDSRYKNFVGKIFEVNIDGIKRSIKIIADRLIDQKFGSGAVGVTPAHSFTDWQLAEQYGLEKIKIIDEAGRMTEQAGKKYTGLKGAEARERFVEYLKENGLLEKEREYENNLSICYRCGSAIEPLPSLQWFVRMKPLAKRARGVVESGEIKIIPKRFEKVYYHWLDNIRDWCISRQLWWGHRLPVWYRSAEKPKNCEIYVGMEAPEGEGWVRDPDVLDTWFSSALWPFSILGWPEETRDYKNFYPTSVMETGYDILFFWVARMIMFGLEFTGRIPFETVYLHGLVRDEQNRKMSKSLGNVLDPLDLIPKYGTDALRLALIVGSTPGQDLPIGESKVKGYRNFSNKIWNASRYVILQVSDGDMQSGRIGESLITKQEARSHNYGMSEEILTSADKIMLEEHKKIKKEVTRLIDEFKFSLAGEKLYDYFWHTFADIYIEASKSQILSASLQIKPQKDISKPEKNNRTMKQLNNELSENTKKILLYILSETLIMLHPFMPYITEAVWQELRGVCPNLGESIIIANWPN